MKQKAFFIIFEGLSLREIKKIEGWDSHFNKIAGLQPSDSGTGVYRKICKIFCEHPSYRKALGDYF